MDRMTELRIFQRVARLASFTRAALSLDVSRATVTRTVRRLEQELGVRLFNRTTRAVSLSAAGARFLHEVEDVLMRCDALFERFQNRDVQLCGTLRVASSTAFCEFFLARALEDFQCLHPALRLELVTRLEDYSASSLVSHRIDLAVCVTDKPPESVVAVTLGLTQSIVCATPECLQRHRRIEQPADLDERMLIPGGFPSVWQLQKGKQCVSLTPQGPISLPDAHLVLESALRSRGFALLPSVAVLEHLAAGRLVQVLEQWRAQQHAVCALLPSRVGGERRLSALLDFLRERLRENETALEKKRLD